VGADRSTPDARDKELRPGINVWEASSPFAFEGVPPDTIVLHPGVKVPIDMHWFTVPLGGDCDLCKLKVTWTGIAWDGCTFDGTHELPGLNVGPNPMRKFLIHPDNVYVKFYEEHQGDVCLCGPNGNTKNPPRGVPNREFIAGVSTALSAKDSWKCTGAPIKYGLTYEWSICPCGGGESLPPTTTPSEPGGPGRGVVPTVSLVPTPGAGTTITEPNLRPGDVVPEEFLPKVKGVPQRYEPAGGVVDKPDAPGVPNPPPGIPLKATGGGDPKPPGEGGMDGGMRIHRTGVSIEPMFGLPILRVSEAARAQALAVRDTDHVLGTQDPRVTVGNGAVLDRALAHRLGRKGPLKP
jgi:hypothetical protein